MQETSIKDTVHRYVDLEAFEKRVVDSPWFQRLRRVRQNDVASTVYPTMLTTRFEHSLGAMHLAGACVDAALDDAATQDNVQTFLRFFQGELAAHGITVASDRLAIFCRRCARMYGALHDIGHPPYSHLIESCYLPETIGITRSPSKHWHETNGAEIIDDLLPRAVEAGSEDADVLKTVAYLSRKDLVTPALVAVKHLVDSVIDVDRMDFVLRDGRNSGSEFGTYDLHRLVESFRIHVAERDGFLQFALIRPLHKALSAIESLIQERYKIYRWVLFHHRIMMSRALMRFVIGKTTSDLAPATFLARNYVPPDTEDRGYILLGDGIIDRHLDTQLQRLRSLGTSLSGQDEQLLTALNILLLRKNLGISLWKRTDAYSNLREPSSFENCLRSEFRGTSTPAPHERLLAAFGSYANWVAQVLGREANEEILRTVVAEMNRRSTTEWYLLEVPAFKKTGDDRILVPTDRPGAFKPDNLSDISNVARAIETARRHDVHLFAFCFVKQSVDKATRRRLQADGRRLLASVIAQLYQSKKTIRDWFEPPELF